MDNYLKPIVAYAVSIALAHVAQRYHLTGDQTTAIMFDLGTAASAAAGMFVHKQVLNQEPPK